MYNTKSLNRHSSEDFHLFVFSENTSDWFSFTLIFATGSRMFDSNASFLLPTMTFFQATVPIIRANFPVSIVSLQRFYTNFPFSMALDIFSKWLNVWRSDSDLIFMAQKIVSTFLVLPHQLLPQCMYFVQIYHLKAINCSEAESKPLKDFIFVLVAWWPH